MFEWRRRNREKFKNARSIEELPGCIRLPFRLMIPGPPNLREDEAILFDLWCRRVSTASLGWWIPTFFGRDSFGRLTLTPRRLIYRAGRAPEFLFLRKPLSRIGDVETSLDMIADVRHLPWRARAGWGVSGLPGYTMIELRSTDGRTLRFGDIDRRAWDRAMTELTALGRGLPNQPPS
jgi:hypothetical protein